MNTKKEKARFTIKFNPANPRHQEAIKMLNEVGRSKAELIADALFLYSHHKASILANFTNRGNSDSNIIQIQRNTMAVVQEKFEMFDDDNINQPNEDDIWQAVNDSIEGFFG